jgi:hypothetical protein
VRYDQRFGYIRKVGSPAALGCCGMGGLGALTAAQIAQRDQITASVAASGNGSQYKTWADTYARLSKKDKDKKTLASAKELASFYSQKYAAYLASKTTTSVPVVPIPGVPAPVGDPVPYVPIDYYGGGGGGGGGSYVPETTPEMSGGYCVNEQGVQVACPQTGGGSPVYTGGNSGFFTPSGQPIPIGTGQIIQTNQVTSDGKPIFYDGRVGQRFFYNATGQPVYYNQATGQWGVTQDMVQAVQPASQALTPVPYVQMPTGYDGAQNADQSGQPVAQPSAYTPVQYVPMPDGSETQVAQLPAGTTSIGEVEFVGTGKAEYSDQWGPIRVIKLVIPKKAATSAAPTATAITGGQALPGGEMKVEDFTAQYAMEGGQW